MSRKVLEESPIPEKRKGRGNQAQGLCHSAHMNWSLLLYSSYLSWGLCFFCPPICFIFLFHEEGLPLSFLFDEFIHFSDFKSIYLVLATHPSSSSAFETTSQISSLSCNVASITSKTNSPFSSKPISDSLFCCCFFIMLLLSSSQSLCLETMLILEYTFILTLHARFCWILDILTFSPLSYPFLPPFP